MNLEKVVYGTLDCMGISSNALDSVNEMDAALQMAKGSAWAREGDPVKCIFGEGKVVNVNQTTGTARIELTSWTLADGQKPVAILQKGHYQKAF